MHITSLHPSQLQQSKQYFQYHSNILTQTNTNTKNMRAGGCTVQQSLTPEASTLVKQSISLARRRGHAQVSPLHVATAMLSSSTGLFRTACVQTHPHYPHQCKALELCFNVALNRLPASSLILGGSPHHHHHLPSLSNALVAAFKRAQAHQRRGSTETQQQPILTVKIELEQLVISILDDPSVSRVMREAAFSSTEVKANVEQAIISSENPTSNPNHNPSEDVTRVVESLASGSKRSIVVVGECLDTTEGVVRGAMNRIEKGEVPKNLLNFQFITLPLLSFRNLGRGEVENKLRELKCLVMSCVGIRGVVLYLGDLKWAAEHMATTSFGEKGRGCNYCPVKHVIMEIRSLVCGGLGERCWVLGISTYKTYMKCRVGDPSLEVVLGLHPINIPTVGSLELSLYCESFSSESQNLSKSRNRDRPSWCPNFLEDGAGNELSCCNGCSIKFENEARCLPKVSSSNQGSVITSTLPSWLQQYKEENKSPSINHTASLHDLCKKWNTICNSTHKHQHYNSKSTLHFSIISPSASSFSSHDQTTLPYPDPKPNSTSSSDTMEMENISMFKELNAENLKVLCNGLEKTASSQRDIIPDIASTILQCRSGMIRRKERLKMARKMEDTWLFFQGCDVEGKEKIAKEIANLVFGSYANLVSIKSSYFSSNRSDSHSTAENVGNKRSRSEADNDYLARFFEAIRENPHRVFLVEDIEQMDSDSQMGIKAAIESGKLRSSNGEEVSTSDAIIILSCESFDSRSRACSPPVRQKLESEQIKVQECVKEISSCANFLDLNLSVPDEEDAEDYSFDDAGLVESVDGVFLFKLPGADL